MAVRKEIQLAHAQRRLRRLEQDAAALRIRAADMPEEHWKPMQNWLQAMVEQQRDAVRRLKTAPGDRSRRVRAA